MKESAIKTGVSHTGLEREFTRVSASCKQALANEIWVIILKSV